MSEHTPTPWTFRRATRPTDGQYDCAIAAVIDGERHIIAETFGRVAPLVFPDSQANAAFIVKAVNSHDALVEALATIADIAEGSGTVNSFPNIAKIARAALETIKERA